MFSAWAILVAAIGIEISSTAALPRSQGFRDPGWTALVLAGYGVSIWMLTLVVDRIPVSIAYAVWSGVGTAGIALIGATFLGETLTPLKVGAIGLIVTGVVALNMQGSAH